LFLFVSLRLAKSNAFSAAIIVDDFNAGGLQRSAQRGFIREGCWDYRRSFSKSTTGMMILGFPAPC
jgi:hypothetical protein